MAETSESAKSGGLIGWVKHLVASAFGLVSGAVLVYLTPLVDGVIKPGKPLANFSVQVQAQTVVINNRSANATEGWWDFGDGSALEPFAPAQDSLSHVFARAGSYNVKLSVRNLIGEENDRAISVNLDSSAVGGKPVVKEFKVTPVPGVAGAYKLQAQIENAQLCVLALGDRRPLEIHEGGLAKEVIFLKHPGTHVLHLAALNGKQSDEKAVVVEVEGTSAVAPAAVSATLQVTYDAVAVNHVTLGHNVVVPWTAGHRDAVCPFEVTRMLDDAHKDYAIVAADVINKADARVRNLQVQLTPDTAHYTLRGELVGDNHWLSLSKRTPPPWVAQMTLGLERRTTAQKVPMDEIPVTVSVPGTTTIPVPHLATGWQVKAKQMHLELRDGKDVVWSGERPPVNAVLHMRGRPVYVTAVEQGDNLVLRVSDAPPAVPVSRPLK